MAHVITQVCVSDESCVPVCPVDAIHPRSDEATIAEMLYIDPVACIDCGACLRACPIDAIRSDDDPRQGTLEFLDLNAAYFAAARPTDG